MILVTGGCGYIGSHIVKNLSASGRSTLVLDNLATGFKDSLQHNEILYVTDLGDRKAVEEVFSKHKIDTVIHMAASVVVPESVKDPLKYYRNNTFNTMQLLDVMLKFDVKKVIFSSTAAVYGDVVGEVDESNATSPMSPYGQSKLMSERIIRDLAVSHGLNFVILRYFNVAGASIDGSIGQRTVGATHLIKVASEVATGKRKQLDIFGTDYETPDGTCIRDYIHVEDLASIHVRALDLFKKDGATAEIFNCGYGKGYSVLEVVKAFKDAVNIDLAIKHSPRRAGDVSQIIANPRKFQKLTGWRPQHDDIGTIVKTAYAFEKKFNPAT